MRQHRFKSLFLHSSFIFLCLLGTLTEGCAESIILDPPQTFPERELILPTPEPTPSPSPSTSFEKAQYQVTQVTEIVKTKTTPYRGMVWPVLIILGLLWALWQLLRVIFELTTSSPA